MVFMLNVLCEQGRACNRGRRETGREEMAARSCEICLSSPKELLHQWSKPHHLPVTTVSLSLPLVR